MGRRSATPGSLTGRGSEPWSLQRSLSKRIADWFIGRPWPPPPQVEGVHREDVSDGFIKEGFRDEYERSRLGICCSGGGIRSASFCLGALQVLRRARGAEQSALGEAAYIASVSGGSYIAVAHTLTVALTPRDLLKAGGPPWAHGSPEEEHLRNNTTYIAPGPLGKANMLIQIVFGFLRHFLPFLAGVYFVAIPTGWLYAHWLQRGLRGRAPRIGTLSTDVWHIWVPVGLICLAGAILYSRLPVERLANPSDDLISAIQTWFWRVLRLGLLVAIVVWALPEAIRLMRWFPTHTFVQSLLDHGHTANAGSGTAAPTTPASPTAGTLKAGAATVISEVIALGGAALGAYRSHKKLAKKLLPLVASLLGYLTLLLPFVVWVDWATRTGFPSPRSAVMIGWYIAFAYLVFRWGFTDSVQPSMYVYYKERLSAAFVRGRTIDSRGWIRGDETEWSDELKFSDLGPKAQDASGDAHLPKLVVCATANLSDDSVPPGRGGASFTFESDYSGGPVTGYVCTKTLENRSRAGTVTLPSLMAISGAAISPSMGWMSLPWARMLMTLFNVRLGVWLPNPLHIGGAKTASGRPIDARNPPGGDCPDHTWRRPGVGYLLRELLGQNSLSRRYVYVTDGGHWENLGLVELLRRGCGQIICIDAAGDDVKHFHTLANAIDLAHSELGIEIDIDTTPVRADDKGDSESCVVAGTIRYPGSAEPGVLIFAKLSMPKDAPVDVRSYHELNPKFPTQPTSDQLFDHRQFEAYRALGSHGARHAVNCLSRWRQRAKVVGAPFEPLPTGSDYSCSDEKAAPAGRHLVIEEKVTLDELS